MFITFDQFIGERKIGKLQKNIKVTVEIDSTVHSDERKFRHSDKIITDSDIVKSANKAIEPVTDELIFDRLDIGDTVHIKDSSNDLNLIAVLNENRDLVVMKIITVMIKPNFKPNPASGSKRVKTIIV